MNSAGVLEKYLLTTADSQGKVLQQVVCGDGICGNVSLIGPEEFNHIRLANPFTPLPFTLNSASALLREMEMADTEVAGWVESGEKGDVLYVSAYHGNQNNALIRDLTPEFEGTQVTLGIYDTSGQLAYYGMSINRDGQWLLQTEEVTTLFEEVEEALAAEARIAEIIPALLARDRETYGE